MWAANRCLVFVLLVNEVTTAKNSAFTNPSGAASLASPDASLLELVDKLGLAKYARVFIEQEVIIFIF